VADGVPVTAGVGTGVETDEVAVNLTGTVAKAATTTLTGTTTAFLSEISVGQIVRVPGGAVEDRVVSAIASDTALTVSVAFGQTSSGQTAQRVSHYQRVKIDGGASGAAAPIGGDATNGLDVDVTRWPKSGTATLANVAGSASSVTLQASNAARIGLILSNDSTATLYVKYGATASATSFTYRLAPGAYWEMPQPIYTGIVDGIWSAANGFARMTELT
jgi:hypothetical protein